MATNWSVSIARNSPVLYQFESPRRGGVLCSGRSISIQTRSVFGRGCCSYNPSSTPLNYNNNIHSQGTTHKGFNYSGIGLGQLVSDRILLSAAVSESGSAGAGGGYGGSGDGDNGGRSGGSGDEENSGRSDGGQNWSLLTWYLDLLATYPVSIKALTSAFLTLIGDLICQIWIDKAPAPDLKRTFLFTLLGLILVGPTLHFWYLYLSNLVTLPGASGAFFRLLLDQFIFSPIFIGVFLSALMTLEGKASQIVPKLQQEWISSVLVNWQLWIPFQFLNFRFVPQQFQVLAANFVALIWNVILSFKAHKEVLK